MTPEKVDEIAQGRVWTGKQARERGLVDDLGGLRAAVQLAASLAKLGDGYRTTYIETEAKGWSQFLPPLPGVVLHWATGQDGLTLPFGGAVRATSEQVQKDLSWLLAKTPGTGSVLTHCLCQVP